MYRPIYLVKVEWARVAPVRPGRFDTHAPKPGQSLFISVEKCAHPLEFRRPFSRWRELATAGQGRLKVIAVGWCAVRWPLAHGLKQPGQFFVRDGFVMHHPVTARIA